MPELPPPAYLRGRFRTLGANTRTTPAYPASSDWLAAEHRLYAPGLELILAETVYKSYIAASINGHWATMGSLGHSEAFEKSLQECQSSIHHGGQSMAKCFAPRALLSRPPTPWRRSTS